MEVISGLLPWRAWAGIAAGLAVLGGLWYVDRAAYTRGVTDTQQKAQVEAVRRVTDMEKTNEKFRALSPLDRCRALLRDSGLPVNECDKR